MAEIDKTLQKKMWILLSVMVALFVMTTAKSKVDMSKNQVRAKITMWFGHPSLAYSTWKIFIFVQNK
jgi:hypothetical protein